MKPQKNQVKDLVKPDEDPHVYEGEIIYENQEPVAIEKKADHSPSKKFAYTLGKITGSAITLLGVIGEVRRWLKFDSKDAGESNNRKGRRIRRRRRRS